jgi:glutathione peroxidase
MSENKTSSIYNFSTTSIKGELIELQSLQNKIIMIVNTASKCGLTPQYEGLQKLHLKYKDQGLVIIGFPCNQFGGQEPQSETEISENCLLNYGVTFIMTHKIEVNGPNADPIFTYLKECLPGLLGLKDIKWNFTKFLIDKTGKPYKRFAPTDEPISLEKDIIRLLEI